MNQHSNGCNPLIVCVMTHFLAGYEPNASSQRWPHLDASMLTPSTLIYDPTHFKFYDLLKRLYCIYSIILSNRDKNDSFGVNFDTNDLAVKNLCSIIHQWVNDRSFFQQFGYRNSNWIGIKGSVKKRFKKRCSHSPKECHVTWIELTMEWNHQLKFKKDRKKKFN